MRIDPLDAFGPSPLFQVPFTSNFLLGSSQDALSLSVPNDAMLLGFAFDIQALDIDLTVSTPWPAKWTDNDIAVTINSGTIGGTQTLVAIPPGTFQMGSSTSRADGESTPIHSTTISYPFWIGKYEVTQSEYTAVMGNNPSQHQGSGSGQRPVENLSWDQAMAYCARLTQAELAAGRIPPGYAYRLPTEAEWEYCARAGTTGDWHTGAAPVCSQANISVPGQTGCGLATTQVGRFPPNAWGIHDMLGNVWEHCLDTSSTYSTAPATNPVSNNVFLDSKETRRIRRGGSYESPASVANAAYRGQENPQLTFANAGFRIVLAPVAYGNVNPSLNMTLVQPGFFVMGSATAGPDATPARMVQITSPYWIGKYEVTQAEWSSLMAVNPSALVNPTHPVVNVSWLDAMEYCRKLTQREYASGGIPAGYQYRLPTEAEWEHACRAGTTTDYQTGSAPTCLQANSRGCVGSTTPVGSYPPNALGLHDMMGNAFEYCIDSYSSSGYAGLPTVDPKPNVANQPRSWRGGAWDAPVGFCASAARSFDAADQAYPVSGFRIVLARFEEGTPRAGEDLKLIPPGTFTMGDPLDLPQVGYTPRAPLHAVRISRAFFAGRTEVTQTQFQAILGYNNSAGGSGTHPVDSVSWHEAKNYCVALTAVQAAASRLPIGYQYRLPTEAEWEYLCRGGTTSEFYTGNSQPSCSDFAFGGQGCLRSYTLPVGSFSDNPFGLKDVHGNVFEWCMDASNDTVAYIDASQPPALRVDPTGPSGPTTLPKRKKVFRSGCWLAQVSDCRSARHNVSDPNWFPPTSNPNGPPAPDSEIGFRVALAPRVAWE
jgi:formylglycine-generating enzyme required for sulfatase activity